MEEASIIGLDLAKRRFQAHGSARTAAWRSARRFRAIKSLLFWPSAQLRRRYGGLRERPSLGTRD